MAGVCGKVTGILSALPSLPTSSLFLCLCVLLGRKIQCKMVLEMLGLPLSISPCPKAAEPQPQNTSSTVFSTFKPTGLPCPAAMLCLGALLGRTWFTTTEPGDQEFLSGSSSSPLPRQMRLCSLKQNKTMQEGRRCWAGGTDTAGAAVPHGLVLLASRPHRVSVLPWFLSCALPLIPTLRDVKEDRHR